NYGIFPSVIANSFIHFCGLPETFQILGVSVWTFPLVMAVMLTIAVTLTLSGGMITVMVTDFLQAQFTHIVFVAMLAVLLWHFSWSDMVDTLKAAPSGESMLNPFDQENVRDFNVVFFLIFAFKAFYNCLGWQGTQG